MRQLEMILDCDGILADCAQGMLQLAESLFGVKATADQLEQWDVCRALGLTKEQEDKLYYEIEKPGWIESLPVLPGAQDAVAHLQTLGLVTIATAPIWSCPTWGYERRRWIASKFGIGYKRMMIGHEKFRIVGDLFLDDKPVTVDLWQKRWPLGVGRVWRYPYTDQDHTHLPRVQNWAEVIALAEQLRSKLAGGIALG
jgi:5'(3')-deoxyribonucleotidase